MNDAIYEKMLDILVENLSCEREAISMESNIIDDLNADSLEIYEIVVAMEQEFELSIPDEDAETIKTVGDAYNYIKNNI